MIRFEDLPRQAQKNFKFTNKLRTLALFLGWALFIGFFLWGMSDIISGKDDTPVLELIYGCSIIASILPGLLHSEFAFKRLFKSLSIFAFIPCAFVITLVVLFGGIFLIVDTILFILRKPLIYPFEYKYFIESKDVQAEMYLDRSNSSKSSHESIIMGNLQSLKEMLEQGLITEEEYEKAKKKMLKKL